MDFAIIYENGVCDLTVGANWIRYQDTSVELGNEHSWTNGEYTLRSWVRKKRNV